MPDRERARIRGHETTHEGSGYTGPFSISKDCSRPKMVTPSEQVPPQLRPFVLPNVRTTGISLGVGAYGSVEKLEVDGLVCAGKKVHEILIDPREGGSQKQVERYYNECILLSQLRHPNIVQFLGICFLPQSRLPVLVTELMQYNLHDLLESRPNIPHSIKHSILKDVAQGLHYLHSQTPSIVHRNITALNVLLNSSLTSKITDFGEAKVFEYPDHKLTPFPGTAAYMSPEARSHFDDETVKYDSKLDIFSFGVLVLFIVTNVFPCDILSATYVDEKEELHARSELERRQKYITVAEMVMYMYKSDNYTYFQFRHLSCIVVFVCVLHSSCHSILHSTFLSESRWS